MNRVLSHVQQHFGLLHRNEIAMLQMLARDLAEESTIVNIGAGRGTSGLAFVEAMSAGSALYTIDIQDSLAVDGSLESERMTMNDAGLGHLLNWSWYQIQGDSKEVGRQWRERGYPWVDLLFIDGDHSFAGCKGDIEVWEPHVVPEGYIAIHDYRKAEHDPTDYGRQHPFPGVDEAVDSLLRGRYPIVGTTDTLIVFRKEFV